MDGELRRSTGVIRLDVSLCPAVSETTDQDIEGLKVLLAVVGMAIIYVPLLVLSPLTHNTESFLSGRWTTLITDGAD